MYVNGSEDVNLYNVTVATNMAGAAAAFYGSITAGHSIFADNLEDGSTPSDCWRVSTNGLTSEDYLLVQTKGSCIIFGTNTNSIFDTPANLYPLANNGGLTDTHALMDTSPAIDGGASACLDSNGVAITTDQCGSVRPADFPGLGTPHCDIGHMNSP